MNLTYYLKIKRTVWISEQIKMYKKIFDKLLLYEKTIIIINHQLIDSAVCLNQFTKMFVCPSNWNNYNNFKKSYKN